MDMRLGEVNSEVLRSVFVFDCATIPKAFFDWLDNRFNAHRDFLAFANVAIKAQPYRP